ncbi:MAG: hypothetical protein L0241_23340 [Planctomycetia bacterium]|nr:hypothetical protein [Planctomycetia bacterium]
MTEVADPRPVAPRWGAVGWSIVVAAFLIGFYNYPWRTVGWRFDHLPGDVVDNRLNLAVLEHGYLYLTGKVDHFWDIGTYYPIRGVTAWSDAHLGMLPLYSALRAIGMPPERAFQGWFLIPFLLNFAAAAWAARRLGLGAVGAAITGYIFAYGLPIVAQTGHAQLVPRFLVPLAVVFAWEWLRAPRSTWRFAALCACLVYQTYISVYIGYFLGLLLATSLLAALILSRGRLPWRDLVLANWRVWSARVVVMALAVMALWPLAYAHTSNGSELPKDHVRLYAPRPMSWITPPGMTAAFPEIAQYTKLGSAMEGAGTEHQLSPGNLSLFGLAVGLLVTPYMLIRGRAFGGPASVVGIMSIAAVGVALLTTKFGENGETWYYGHIVVLPGASGIRAIGRIALILTFPAGLAIGAFFDLIARCAERFSRPAAVGVAIVALGAVATDQWLTPTSGQRKNDWWWARTSLPEAVKRRERVAEAIRSRPNATIVYAFPSVADKLGQQGPAGLQLDVMRGSQDCGVRTVNGWSGRAPNQWEFFPDYRSLMKWLIDTTHVSPDQLEGLIVIGEPAKDPDPAFDAQMRAKYPPVLIE